MRVFIDTEFTSLSDPQLISIGAVSEHSERFYAVRSDYPRRACTAFVAEHVLPLLDVHAADVCGSQEHVARALSNWLAVIRRKVCEDVALCADDACDLELVRQLVGDTVPGLALRLISGDADLRHRLQEFFVRNPGVKRHNALDDALALRAAMNTRSQDV